MTSVMLLALLASATCLATPVKTGDGVYVRSGPITGYITPPYDVVRGRFSLHVGPWRVKNSLSQKIPWFVRDGVDSGPAISMTGVRLSPLPARTFRQVFPSAGSGYQQGAVYPSNISPPAAGCWRLTMRTGSVTARFVVLVRN
jgi:hypothetical protein